MRSSISKFIIGALVCAGVSTSAQAKTYADIQTVVKKIAQLVRDQFVDEVVASNTADEILKRYTQGKYADIQTTKQLARRLTDELRAISGDTHIGIVFDPDSVDRYRARANAKSSKAAKAIDMTNKIASSEESRLDNYGMRGVEVLAGGVGYFRIDYFDGHDKEGAPAIASAMNLLASSNAIILDLRRNGGGNSRILSLFLGYFLGPNAVHYATRTERWKNSVEELYSRADVKGARHFDKPIYILTSGTTYSLAESVAYHLRSFNRAVIIGERTYGGGNGWDPVVLNDDFFLRLPRTAFVNAVTNSMFPEKEGISPDIAVSSASAMQTAYLEALANLRQETSDIEKKQQIEWAQRVVFARQHARVKSVDADVKKYAGEFGEFLFEAREDGLWLSFRDLPFVKLERLATGLYFDDRSIQRQFQFAATEQALAFTMTVMPYGEDSIKITRKGLK